MNGKGKKVEKDDTEVVVEVKVGEMVLCDTATTTTHQLSLPLTNLHAHCQTVKFQPILFHPHACHKHNLPSQLSSYLYTSYPTQFHNFFYMQNLHL